MDLIGNGGWGCEFLLWFMDWFNLLLLLLFLSFVLEVWNWILKFKTGDLGIIGWKAFFLQHKDFMEFCLWLQDIQILNGSSFGFFKIWI